MLLAQAIQSTPLVDGEFKDFCQEAKNISRRHSRSKTSRRKERKPSFNVVSPRPHVKVDMSDLKRTPIRRRHTLATSKAAQSAPLRLADLAKHHVMAQHVENWREDSIIHRQYLPMQHILGSLKRKDDNFVDPALRPKSTCVTSTSISHFPACSSPPAFSLAELGGNDEETRQPSANGNDLASPNFSATSGSSSLDILQTPPSFVDQNVTQAVSTSPFIRIKREASNLFDDPDFDRRFKHHSTEHVAKPISPSAFPGLNIALNSATVTREERDLFSEYAPQNLDDPQRLMNEVVRMREEMIHVMHQQLIQGSVFQPASAQISTSTSRPITELSRIAEIGPLAKDLPDLSPFPTDVNVDFMPLDDMDEFLDYSANGYR